VPETRSQLVEMALGGKRPIHPNDHVVIARRQLLGGTAVSEESIAVVGLVPPGHKVATRAIAAGEPVRRYDQIIGTATQAIAPGQHVHVHNLAFSDFRRAHEPGAGTTPTAFVDAPATFDGIVRADGRVATRNYIGVLTSVNCSATAARAIADHFRRDVRPEALAESGYLAGQLSRLSIPVAALVANRMPPTFGDGDSGGVATAPPDDVRTGSAPPSVLAWLTDNLAELNREAASAAGRISDFAGRLGPSVIATVHDEPADTGELSLVARIAAGLAGTARN
jgi:hypothetical protein